ncbi:ankyrin repeat and MYND domain-containing protein 1 isoform X2 [Choloepus didactylus]|uniref:ankyrin repeat and MYND domain-containing protein 1 isoform X2 n=2 Tax=Choloepus didactylus TaxID=27675 RepID=UPI00189D3AEF|nr:ankyrin repeat and MYND domain-containing protein 1 isoform X2 [Choloepus didactylus]
MKGVHSSLELDSKASKTRSSEAHLEKGSELAEAQAQEDLESWSFSSPRGALLALEGDEEEAEGPLREPDLKASYAQLVEGVQEWSDGCVYRGQFGLDMKLGFGEFSWPTGESYRGQFYRDHRHGWGTYTWPDGSSFTGSFYLSQREGYGTMYLKTRLFQGLYRADERFGPGIETYSDGSQDVGLWFREHLVKLCLEIPGGFSILGFPEFAPFLLGSRARISLPDEEKMEWGLDEGKDPFFYEYKRFILNDDLTLPPEMHVYSTNNGHLPMTCSLRKDLDVRLLLNDLPPLAEEEEPWPVINETPLLLRMQKQVYKFRNRKAHSSWNMGAILEGQRGGFAPGGPKEQLSRELILKAEAGDLPWIRGVLRDNLASADVADARGYTVLAAATVRPQGPLGGPWAWGCCCQQRLDVWGGLLVPWVPASLPALQVHCHTHVISLLLDSGADVNRCTDDGLTPLSISFLLYYPATSFLPNIAERTLPEPQEGATKGASLPSPAIVLTEAAPEAAFYEDVLPEPSGRELRPAVPLSGSEDDTTSLSLQPSGESADLRSTSRPGSVHNLEQGLDEAPGNLDKCTLCSYETNFESNLCVHGFSIKLSADMLEKSAQVYSMLRTPSVGASDHDKGTVRRMAQSMVRHRNRWLTIRLLLQRGADPNLCRVPMQVLFLAVKTGDVDAVKLLLESGARTDVRLPAQLRALTPLHIAAGLPGEEGVRITELLLHAITDVDARAADQHETYRRDKLDLLPSSLKLSNEAGPPGIHCSRQTPSPDEGGRTALHVACEREDSHEYARDVVRLLLSHRANPNMLWSGHSPLSLSIASGNDLIVKELLSHGADPNLPLTQGLGSALCVVCDPTYENLRSMDSKLALIDRLIAHGADILSPVTLMQGDKVAVGTAVDYGYFKFFQDRKIAHCPFHALMPAERETFLARKRLLEYMGCQLRRAVFAKESQWDPKVLYLSKRAELSPGFRLKKKGAAPVAVLKLEEQEKIPFFKFCSQCGRSVGVHLSPCTRCYGVLTCSKNCKSKAWSEFHRKDCGAIVGLGKVLMKNFQKSFWKPPKKATRAVPRRPGSLRPPVWAQSQYSTYSDA